MGLYITKSGLSLRTVCYSLPKSMQALLSILNRRSFDTKDKDTALERCEFELQAHTDETKCRLIVRMVCRHGVVKTYRLIYEPTNVLRATFDRINSPNHWTTAARTLRDIVEFFGANTDQLDWSFEKGKVTFTSYAERITDGRDIFKQPMHTSVAIERKDFSDFSVQEGLHIGIVVRDFRAIVSHADALGVSVTARYSRGNRPVQIAYENDGILCEFTLMTRGPPADVSAAAGTRTGTPARDLSVRPVQRPPAQNTASRPLDRHSTPTPSATVMPPPAVTLSFKNVTEAPHSAQRIATATKFGQVPRNRSPPAPSASLDQHSLFFPAGEDEHFWDEHDHDTAEPEDFVTWDASGHGLVLSEAGRRIRDSEPATSFPGAGLSRADNPDLQGIAPTQRLSQLKGLFD
jgi:cell cycle checkpoint control protein RAD9A